MPAGNGPAVAGRPRARFFSDVSLGRRKDAINILATGSKSRPFVNGFVTIAR
jgi:hypothetical protein